MSAVSIIFRQAIASAYSKDAAAQALFLILMLIYFPCVAILDSVQNVMGGVMRGLGKQAASSWIYLFFFYGVMLPLGCFLAFPCGVGVEGVWYAMGLGLLLSDLAFAALLYKTNFKDQIAVAGTRIKRSLSGCSFTSSYTSPHACRSSSK